VSEDIALAVAERARNRCISEPPSHLDCAIYSARVCPFLANPRMRRNARDLYAPDGTLRDGLNEAAGIGLKRNPGAVCVWVTKEFRVVREGNGVLFRLGDPEQVLWFAEGRPATRDEVLHSIETGLPILADLARQEGPAAQAALAKQRETALALVPAE
jgi:hypothetical protein